MKKIVIATVFCIMSYANCITSGAATIGTWNAYMAYHEIQQIKEVGDNLFVLASNNLYKYNTIDQSITTYDKTNGLSDTYITNIAWNKNTRNLIAVYENSNIDLIKTNGEVTNIPDLYTKTMTEDKTVNSIFIYERYAFLSTNFGVVKVNMSNAEISETYKLNTAVSRTAVNNNNIYTQISNGTVLAASMADNLLDKNNWNLTTNYPAGLFDEDRTDYDKHYPLVSTLSPEGPDYNYFDFLKMKNGKLYTCGGGRTGLDNYYRKGIIQVYDGDKWTIFQGQLDTITGVTYRDVSCIDIYNGKIFASSASSGIYEFDENGKYLNHYSLGNSELYSTFEGNPEWVLVNAMSFDSKGNLWMLNSLNTVSSIVEFTKDGEWVKHNKSVLFRGNASMYNMRDIRFDSRGLMWFTNDHWEWPALVCYDPSTDDIKSYETFVNQDGQKLTLNSVFCVQEDTEGNIWIGTDKGPLMFNKSQIGTSGETFTQVKIPRNDGTNYADYLLDNIPVTDIEIDGGGRKWMSTSDNGVYLISADNMEEVHHFTTTNSNILSDKVNSIAINNKTGEVFFATDKGLCSYMGDATEPVEDMDKDNVYAYPNPVDPGYTGLITVVGLSLDADVKVTTATGYLVAEGKSNGGTFTWNGHDRKGKRVASGIYNVIAAKSDGSKGTVCKIAVVN